MTWRELLSNPFGFIAFVALAFVALLPLLCLLIGVALVIPKSTRATGACLLSAVGGFFVSFFVKASYDELNLRGGFK